MKVSVEELKEQLLLGLTTREIARNLNCNYGYVSYLTKKHELQDLLLHRKPDTNINYFDSIDTKEKAYVLGFILADGTLSSLDKFSLSIAIQDKEVIDFIASELGCRVHEYLELDKEKRRFPQVNISLSNHHFISRLKALFGGNLKKDRRLPRIRLDLEKYLLLGFFDGDGCVTWGRRKDRNRLWHKISFTSSYSLLIGIQNILLKNGIATRLYPKTNSDCYVVDFANKEDIIKFLDLVYTDMIILNRKFNKANALRLELEELGEA